MAEDTPALFDRVIDSSHRSFLAVVQRVKLNVLRPRPPAELIPVDPQDGYARHRDEALAVAVCQSYHRFSNTLD